MKAAWRRSSLHGFTEGNSCLTNLLAFYGIMTGWADEERAVGAVCLDFSKAFDSVFSNIFVHKLRKMSRDMD